MPEQDTADSIVLGAFGTSSVVNLQTGAGGPTDPATTQALRTVAPLDRSTLDAACRTGVYQQLCRRLPLAALSEAPTVEADEALAERVQDRLTELRAWPLFGQAAAAAERQGVAGLLIQTDGRGDLAVPLAPGERITGLRVVYRHEMTPRAWVEDFGSPRLGEPESIEMRLRMRGRECRATLVHYSRVVLLHGPADDSELGQSQSIDEWDYYGLPMLDRLRDTLPLLLTLSRETSRQIQIQGVLVQTLSEQGLSLLMDKAGSRTIRESVELMRTRLSSAGVAVQMPGMELSRLGAGSEHYDQIEQAVYRLAALTLGWPLELVNGQPPPGLGDTGRGGRIVYGALVTAYQEDVLRRPAQDLVTVIAIEQGAAGQPIDVVFGDPLPASPLERAQLRQAHTTADALAVQAGIVPAEHFALRYRDGEWREDLPPYEPATAPLAVGAEPGEQAPGEAVPVAAATEPKEPIPVDYASTMLQLVAEHALHPERAEQYRGMLAAMGIGAEVAAVILPDVAPAQPATV